MSRAEEIKHLLEKSRQMGVDQTYPITENEVIEFISSSFEFGFVCGALWQKQQDQARSAVEIAREEVIEWIDNHWREYVNVDADGVVCFGHWKNDLRKAFEDE